MSLLLVDWWTSGGKDGRAADRPYRRTELISKCSVGPFAAWACFEHQSSVRTRLARPRSPARPARSVLGASETEEHACTPRPWRHCSRTRSGESGRRESGCPCHVAWIDTLSWPHGSPSNASLYNRASVWGSQNGGHQASQQGPLPTNMSPSTSSHAMTERSASPQPSSASSKSAAQPEVHHAAASTSHGDQAYGHAHLTVSPLNAKVSFKRQRASPNTWPIFRQP